MEQFYTQKSELEKKREEEERQAKKHAAAQQEWWDERERDLDAAEEKKRQEEKKRLDDKKHFDSKREADIKRLDGKKESTSHAPSTASSTTAKVADHSDAEKVDQQASQTDRKNQNAQGFAEMSGDQESEEQGKENKAGKASAT